MESLLYFDAIPQDAILPVMPDNDTTWLFSGSILDCSKPILMGIVNVTPDSFSDGGRFFDTLTAIEHARKLADQGADILDVGGESTRPGSDPVMVDDEIARVVPVIEGIRNLGTNIPISIDTRRLKVAQAAVDAGAVIVNDVAALMDDPDLVDFVAEKNLGVVLMHMQGRPKVMQEDPHYDNVIAELGDFFKERLDFSVGKGIPLENIVIDPGIGFGKFLEHNLEILNRCGEWLNLKRPVMIGPSRKRFIGEILGADVDKRLYGTIGACVTSLISGARIFRVHDVEPVRDALKIAWSIITSSAFE